MESSVNSEHFNAVVRSGHKDDAVEVPFDPAQRWGMAAQPLAPGRRGYPVTGTVNGAPLDSEIVSRSRRFWLLLPGGPQRAAGSGAGEQVAVEIAPRDSTGPNAARDPA